MAEQKCEGWWTDPATWLSAASCGYGSGYEPGSMQEWNPDCPAHPPRMNDDIQDLNESVHVGRCGGRAPVLVPIAAQAVCALPAGHPGWHKGDDGSEWNEYPTAKADQ